MGMSDMGRADAHPLLSSSKLCIFAVKISQDTMARHLALLLLLALVGSCRGPEAPLVGISSSRSSSGGTLLASAYSEAVSRAGGVPVVIPAVKTREEADAILGRLDGIIFSGGEDIEPAWYGEEVLNGTVSIDPVRDHSDSLLARAALSCGKPVLGICRGEQLLNVIIGGSLYQDIPSQVEGSVRHGGGAEHLIRIEDGSLLGRLFGMDTLTVNSYHHQAVKEPAPGVKVTARSEDGIVEAYEAPGLWAVQFHPEKSLKAGDGKWIRLFEAFVEACR